MYEYLIVKLEFDGTCRKASKPGQQWEDIGNINDLAAQNWEIHKVLMWQEGGISGGMQYGPGGFVVLRKPRGGASGAFYPGDQDEPRGPHSSQGT